MHRHPMKKVLITGATGFIGRQSLPLLVRRGYEVHAVFSKFLEKNQKEVHWHKADLLDLTQVSELLNIVKPTHLLHFAWYMDPKKCWNSVENFKWVQSSLCLLQSFILNGGYRVVMAGTCAEYDWKYGYCSEQITPLSPNSIYGSCKHSLQLILSAFSKETGLSSSWGRIFFVYGPHEHPERLVSSVINSLLLNKVAQCSHGNQIRDYLYVEDVADAFVALLESDVQGPINVASGYPISIKKIVSKICERLNRKDLIHFGAIPSANDEAPLLVADVRRLSNEVKWNPKYDLDSGLEHTIEWWKARLSFLAKREI